ncbi:MAG: DUF4003 family protein [Planctomycetota bacterium]|nr:DUF4003 family protein [Planctomycetota bacterium]
MSQPFTLPADPTGRLLQLTSAIAEHKSWLQSWSILRYAALGLITCEGEPKELVEELFELAVEVKAKQGFFSGLRSDVRYCLVATLMRHGSTFEQFREVFTTTREWFRAAKLPRGETQEAMACLILMEAAEDDTPTRAQVDRVAEVFAGMRSHHRILTGSDDYPSAALLATTDAPVDDLIERVEAFYAGLRDLKFGRSNQLQLASHMLAFAPANDEEVLVRFRRLYSAFQERGLLMNRGDYDEVAILSFLPQAADTVVSQVLDDREVLREGMQPRPSKQEGFTFGASTAFLSLATNQEADGTTLDALQMAQVISLLAAQQAAVMAAVSASVAAAAAAG